MIEFPWWIGLLILLLVFIFYVGIGAILCFAVTYAMLTRSVQKGNEAFGSRSNRIGISLMMGGFGGALIQYVIVRIITGGV